MEHLQFSVGEIPLVMIDRGQIGGFRCGGVYILIGADATLRAHVGWHTNVAAALERHARRHTWWSRALVVKLDLGASDSENVAEAIRQLLRNPQRCTQAAFAGSGVEAQLAAALVCAGVGGLIEMRPPYNMDRWLVRPSLVQMSRRRTVRGRTTTEGAR